MQFPYNDYWVELDINEHDKCLRAYIYSELEETVTVEASTATELAKGVYYVIGNEPCCMQLSENPFVSEHFLTATPEKIYGENIVSFIGEKELWFLTRIAFKYYAIGSDASARFNHLNVFGLSMKHGAAAWEFAIESERSKRRDGGAKGGKKRTDEQKKRYETHRYWWDRWQLEPDLYKSKTAYDEAMRDKTGAGAETIRRHRREFDSE